jgi:heterodisulfide reductase subunit A-like polyferredoxin
MISLYAPGRFVTSTHGPPAADGKIIEDRIISMKKDNAATTGSVLVLGGGISGMQAALDLADSGYYVYLVEESAAIGGAMAQLDKTFPTNDCSM